TPWCALTINYCLVSSGFPGNDSLWALDFAKYGTKLSGPALGAIACKKRQGGGHVFLVVGRTPGGKIIGRGGNQSDMVCDQLFDPLEIVAYPWPRNASAYLPDRVGLDALPIVMPAAKEKRQIALPPPATEPASGKGTLPPPKDGAVKKIGAPAAGVSLIAL